MSVARSSGEGCGEHLVALSASARDGPPLVASDGQVRERKVFSKARRVQPVRSLERARCAVSVSSVSLCTC